MIFDSDGLMKVAPVGPWKGKTIEYDLDSIGCMTSFQPMDLDDTF